VFADLSGYAAWVVVVVATIDLLETNGRQVLTTKSTKNAKKSPREGCLEHLSFVTFVVPLLLQR